MITNFKIYEGVFFSENLKVSIYEFLKKSQNFRTELDYNEILINYGHSSKELFGLMKRRLTTSHTFTKKRPMPISMQRPYSDSINFKKEKNIFRVYSTTYLLSVGYTDKIFDFIVNKIQENGIDIQIYKEEFRHYCSVYYFECDVKNYDEIVNVCDKLSIDDLELYLDSNKYNL
jgi:hypothetical protein